MNWRIYYSDGTTYDGDPWNAPSLGVILVVHKDIDCGKYIALAENYYVYDVSNDAFVGCDLFGLWDYLQQPGHKKVLFGRTIQNEEYQKIYQDAKNDPDFPAKTAYRSRETKL